MGKCPHHRSVKQERLKRSREEPISEGGFPDHGGGKERSPRPTRKDLGKAVVLRVVTPGTARMTEKTERALRREKSRHLLGGCLTGILVKAILLPMGLGNP